MSADYPEFDQAVVRLKAVLRSEGIDRDVVFFDLSDLLVAHGRWWLRHGDTVEAYARARSAYANAVERRLGVSLIAQCAVANAVGVSVGGPSDPDEAERLMYPDGLKLSVATPLREAQAVLEGQWAEQRERLVLEGHAHLGNESDLLK